MSEKDVMERNLKLSVFNSFPYKRLRRVCDAICELGFDCEFVDNGNVVFTDKGFMSIEEKMKELGRKADDTSGGKNE